MNVEIGTEAAQFLSSLGIFTINVPVVYIVRYVMVLRGAYP